VLGDPGARDVFMQAVQGCRPDQMLLPVSIGRVLPAVLGGAEAKRLTVVGIERDQEPDAIVWDVTVQDETGKVVESWQGLRLQVVRTGRDTGAWPDPLLGPYLERRAGDLLQGPVPRVVVEPHADSTERPLWTSRAVGRLLGHETTVRHRPDGKPEVAEGVEISLAHGAGLTLAVAGERLTCDVEPVASRSEQEWLGLLGENRYALAGLLSRESSEDISVAATRVWCAAECAQKAGRPVEEPLTLLNHGPDGWVVLRTGDARIATYVTTLRHRDGQAVFAVRGGS
jgi:enediyne polyketide synthase